MARPRIVVDDAVYAAREAFAALGEVVALPGSSIDRSALKGADALVVRSVTRVDEPLVEGSGLRFVGSATAGTDHVDVEALVRHEVAFAHAPGCNAEAVAQWCAAAWVRGRLRGHDRFRRAGPIGIVGWGHAGRAFGSSMRSAFGLDVLACDPPRVRTGDTLPKHSLDQLRQRCSTISLHVSLHDVAPDQTRGLVREDPGAALIQASRGAVVEEAALLAMPPGSALVDVWPGEPQPSPHLLADAGAVLQASPHVAGYATASKVNATAQVRSAMEKVFPVRGSWTPPSAPRLALRLPEGDTPLARLDALIESVVALDEDDAAMRGLALVDASARGPAFEELRRTYRLRPRFGDVDLELGEAEREELDRPLEAGLSVSFGHALSALGFLRGD